MSSRARAFGRRKSARLSFYCQEVSLSETGGDVVHNSNGNSAEDKLRRDLAVVLDSDNEENQEKDKDVENSSLQNLWKAHDRVVEPLARKRRESSVGKRRDSVILHDMAITDAVEILRQRDKDIEQAYNINVDDDKSPKEISGCCLEDEDNSGLKPDTRRLRRTSTWSRLSAESVDFDTWDVLKDEYANDFGYEYANIALAGDFLTPVDSDESDLSNNNNMFLIIGTTADDKTAQPHVLSPPLMDTLMNFIPEQLCDENYWLKFSLVRDGATMETMKQYCKGSKYTIMAIETNEGEVFGSFTSEYWRTQPSFYGTAPAFVWKMRQSRKVKCSSLYEQVQLETSIDVYPFSGKNNYVQVCREGQIAVGGSSDSTSKSQRDFDAFFTKANTDTGFAITLDDDLLMGTTSPCIVFKSPALCGDTDDTTIFTIANLEVWTFTPMPDEDSAQRLEMAKYVAETSVTNNEESVVPIVLSSSDIVQDKFFERLGDDAEGDERRQRWQETENFDATSPQFI